MLNNYNNGSPTFEYKSQTRTYQSTPTYNHQNLRNSTNHINSAYNHEKRVSSGIQFGGSEKCARCLKAVYAAEKVVAAGKNFHKLCFTCFTCKKMLSSMNCCDNSEGEIFCKCK